MRYSVVTAMQDEAANLPRLALSLLSQTSSPTQWIMVDSGSTDETVEIARSLCALRPWIVLETIPGSGAPRRGARVVDALHHAFALLSTEVDVVVKVDADVSFDRRHLELLLGQFEADAQLGIASGVRHEFDRGRWRPQSGTATTVEAQVRAYRRSCLASILPLERRMGWDVVDESAAIAQGWRAGRFREVAFRHHRRVGERDASRRAAWRAQGAIAHHLGYRSSYLLARACFRAARESAALFMVSSFLVAKLSRRPQSSNLAAIAIRRSQQRMRYLPLRVAESLTGSVAKPSRLGRATLLLPSDVGGHLLELCSLADALQPHSRVWVTEDTPDSRELLDGERVWFVTAAKRRGVAALARSLVMSWRIVSAVRPTVAISTGSARAVPLLWVAKLRGARVVFIECAGRVEGESLSRRLVAPIADRTYVQWPEQVERRKGARYAGMACLGHTGAVTRRLIDQTLSEDFDIVVTVGTCEFAFERLIRAVEAAGALGPRALVQAGTSDYRPKEAFTVDFVSPSLLYNSFRRAKIVVCHAGIGSVALALAAGHVPIVMPRRQRFNEQIDDHQVDFARRLAGLGLVSVVESAADAERAIQRANDEVEPDRALTVPHLADDLRRFIGQCVEVAPAKGAGRTARARRREGR